MVKRLVVESDSDINRKMIRKMGRVKTLNNFCERYLSKNVTNMDLHPAGLQSHRKPELEETLER